MINTQNGQFVKTDPVSFIDIVTNSIMTIEKTNYLRVKHKRFQPENEIEKSAFIKSDVISCGSLTKKQTRLSFFQGF